MKNLICVQLESETRDSADEIVAYFRQEPTKADWENACDRAASFGFDYAITWELREEDPTEFSRATHTKRYCLTEC